MIITCTKCEKRFVVPDNAIPAEGRTVQCSACSNKWKQLPIEKKENPVKAQSIAVKKKRTKKRKMPAPYSKDYMKQKWGVGVKNYAQKKGLTEKPTRKKNQFKWIFIPAKVWGNKFIKGRWKKKRLKKTARQTAFAKAKFDAKTDRVNKWNKRRKRILLFRKGGKSLKEIGKKFKISKQRVLQIINETMR